MDRARSAYEWDRVAHATKHALFGVPLVALFVALSPRPQFALVMAAALVLLFAVFFWRGQSLGRSVVPGVLAGLIPFGFAWSVRGMGHCAMVDGECVSWCAPACALGGVLAVLVVRRFAGRDPYRWFGAGAVSLLTGAFGCSCVSWHGSAALAAAMLLALPPAFAAAKRAA